MLVQRVMMPVSSLESWTVLGDAGGPVGPIERYLAYLADIERSPNMVKAYAHDLKDWFEFLVVRGLDWREVRLEDLGEFVAWLRLPPTGRAGGVALLPSAEHHCSAVTVNRKLSAVNGLYTFCSRHGVDLGDLVTELQPTRRRSRWMPFLYHLSAGEPERRRAMKLHSPRKQPVILTAAQVQAVLDACAHLRDRLLWALLWAARYPAPRSSNCGRRPTEHSAHPFRPASEHQTHPCSGASRQPITACGSSPRKTADYATSSHSPSGRNGPPDPASQATPANGTPGNGRQAMLGAGPLVKTISPASGVLGVRYQRKARCWKNSASASPCLKASSPSRRPSG